MAEYFEEMNFDWNRSASENYFVELARLFLDYNMFEELRVKHKLAPPAAKEAVEALENLTVDESGLKCPICLKEHVKGEVLKKLPCSHSFHVDCIMPWLDKTNTCPVCRYEFPTDDDEYEAYRKEKKREKQREEEIENLHNSMFS